MTNTVHMRLACMVPGCKAPGALTYEGDVPRYLVGLVGIWFHSSHEGHLFAYWEDGVKILPPSDVPDPHPASKQITVSCPQPQEKCKQQPRSLSGTFGPHQLAMAVLQLHTQHGSCGMDVRVDGEQIA